MVPHRSKNLYAALPAVLFANVLALASPALSQETQQPPAQVAPSHQGMHAPPPASTTSYDEATPPLFDNLGSHSWKITTSNPQAQAFFDQGLRLAYGFNHAEARRAFRQAQRLDPNCAMCAWGEAYVLGPNINVPMDPTANAPALAALQRAQALAPNANEKEQALIQALAQRYSPDPNADRRQLDEAWANALGQVAQRFPEDNELPVLHAEGMMDTQPWDYWTDGGRQAKGHANEIVSQLERAMTNNPDHPGALHLYIHAVEASDRPERAEPAADHLAALMPGAGHIVHMPSHIYYRVGRYQDALAANKAAVAADDAYIAAVDPTGPYPLAYYPHNVHFLMAAAQLAGDANTAQEAAAKIQRIVAPETANAVPMVQSDMAAPYWVAAIFGTPESVLAMTVPDNAPSYVKGIRHYARGSAYASQGRLEQVLNETTALGALEEQEDFAKGTAAGVPGPQVFQIAREILNARVAQAQNDLETAIASYRRAAELQESLPYFEPPYWYYPVRQSLGAALLRAGRNDEAEQAFRAALERAPNSGWALHGLAETAKARGDQAAAQDAEARLVRIWVGDRRLLDLSRF
jgi:tetratricopeptide (TPR) repeat protein